MQDKRSRLRLFFRLLFAAAFMGLALVGVEFVLYKKGLFPPYHKQYTNQPWRLENLSDIMLTGEDWWAFDPAGPLNEWRAKFWSNGFREQIHELKKTEGTQRVLVIGDSVTFGVTLDDYETIPAMLRHGMNWADGVWEVINAGVSGWNSWNIKQFLEFKALPEMTPDIVVYNIVQNDFVPLDDQELESVYDQRQKEESGYKLRLASAYKWLRYRVALLIKGGSFSMDVARGPALGDKLGQWGKDKWWFIRGKVDAKNYPLALKLTVDRIRKMDSLCKEKGVKFLAVIVPTSSQTSKRYHTRSALEDYEGILDARSLTDVENAMKAAGIECFNLLPAFREPHEQPHFVDECHLTPSGCQVTARALLARLQELKWVTLWERPFWQGGSILGVSPGS